MYPTNEKTWYYLKSYCSIMPLTIKKHELSLTTYQAILTWFSCVSDLNKIIKQEQKEAVPSTFTFFTKQKIIHYVEASSVSATGSAHNCCTDTAIWNRKLSLIVVNSDFQP
jgi:hypothetical protein